MVSFGEYMSEHYANKNAYAHEDHSRQRKPCKSATWSGPGRGFVMLRWSGNRALCIMVTPP